MTATATQGVACPKCGGPMWDNRGKKTNPKAPDFKCKDKGCDGVIWPPKNTAPAAEPQGPTLVKPTKSIAQMYIESTDFVLATIVPKYLAKEIGPTPEAVAAMVHTIFIARRKEER